MLVHKAKLIYSWVIRSALFFAPDIPLLMRLRGFFYKPLLVTAGKNFQVTHDVILRCTSLQVGDNVYLANSVIVLGKGEIKIGDNVHIGPHSVIVSSKHKYFNHVFQKESESGPILIGEGSWVGANCTVTIGAALPAGSALGANALLNKKFDQPYSLYAGVPAKLIKAL